MRNLTASGYSQYIGRVGGLAVALGIGAAIASVTAVAAADAGAAEDSSSPAAAAAGPQRSASAGAGLQRSASAASHRPDRRAGTDSVARTAERRTPPPAATRTSNRPAPAAAVRVRIPTPPAAPVDSANRESAAVAAPTASATAAGPDLLGQASAFFGLPGAPASSAPTINSLGLLPRLVLDDVFGGSAPAPSVDATAVITGLFREVLRKDPTATELENYQGIWRFSGINGVVAGLYGSTAFRQTQVESYYLELLGRTATEQELSWGATQLIWGTPEPLFAASLAGGREFYQASSFGGGTAGLQPSATTYVNLLYRSMLGSIADSNAAPYISQVEIGIPTSLVSVQFATSDSFREVKVNEIFNVVLNVSPTPDVLDGYVSNWFFNGGVAGIATVTLASGENAALIESGQVPLPDMVAVSQMQQLLLAPYSEQQSGFVKLFNNLLGNPTKTSPCTLVCANPPLYELMTEGAPGRSIPNNAVKVTPINASVADLIPTQNEIGMAASLRFPLQNPTLLEDFFAGGDIRVVGPIVTANGGKYVIDGHHRWSQLLMINPLARIVAEDIGYVPSPQEALRQAQIAVAAQLGYLEGSRVLSDNLYTISRTEFDTAVAGYIRDGSSRDAVIAVFTANLGLEGQTDAEKIVSIQNYLWGNVERMRTNNPFIPGATSRPYMPQVDPLYPILNYLRGPSTLSFSFPIIGYLG